MITTFRPRRAAGLLVGIALAGATVAGCSSDGVPNAVSDSSVVNTGQPTDVTDPSAGAAEPNANGGFSGGPLTPVPDAAVPSQDPVVDNGTTTQSFTIEGNDAKQVVVDYISQATAAGWAPAGELTETGDDVWSAGLEKDGTTLTVTAGPSTDLTAGAQDVIELSIETTGT